MLSERVDQRARGRRRAWVLSAVVISAAAALVLSVGPRVLDRMTITTPPEAVHEVVPPSHEGDASVEAPPLPEPPTVEAPVEPIAPPPVVEDVTPPTASELPLQQPKATLDGSPSAAELARAAERSMAAGRRDETIKILTQLVRRYPKSSPARAALFDLGRLLRASGRNDEARCAYKLIRSRWPNDPMRGEIDRVLTSLGNGPGCRGLQPL
jgi:hypothetical protein